MSIEKETNLNREEITKIIQNQGSSIRKADSIRINPILASAMLYWTSVIDRTKSKPDVIEAALLNYIPEEYLIEGYKIAKKENRI